MSGSLKCLACGSVANQPWATAEDVEYCSTPDRFAYHRCDACQALFIDPVPSDRLSTIYPANYYSFQPGGKSFAANVKDRMDRAFFRSILKELQGTSLRVLDIGGGAGYQLDAVRSVDPRVRHTHVVDLDPNAAEIARSRGHVYWTGSIENFESAERFDLVLLLNLIEHVTDPGAVLAKINRMLAPGGRVIVKTPNHDALDARIFRHRNWAGYHCPRHFVLFTRAGFERLLGRAGLQTQRFAYTQGAPFWAASVLCWLAKRDMVDVSAKRPVVYHPLFGVLGAAFAALDFARRPWSRTSQMFFVLEKAGAPVTERSAPA